MKTERGFTLIEVLVAMVVLSIGLLGLAGLQATSLKSNQSAYHRSQATQLAYEMADRMRANRVYAKVLLNNVYTTTDPAEAQVQPTCFSASTCPETLQLDEDGNSYCPVTEVVGCTAAQMAQNDLREWSDAINSTLPSGMGTISNNGSIFTITLSWTEDRYAQEGGTGTLKNTTDTTSLKMSFQL
ncbi:MAG: type IV pilus modification protein PilV [Methylococcaceae bacterium]|nr:type IV pilus modification protein PilV [Methylococcaceae bacterium]